VVKSPEELEIEAARAYENSLRNATMVALAAQTRKDNAVGTACYIGAGCAIVATAVYAFRG
jgi:hypothetical protein